MQYIQWINKLKYDTLMRTFFLSSIALDLTFCLDYDVVDFVKISAISEFLLNLIYENCFVYAFALQCHEISRSWALFFFFFEVFVFGFYFVASNLFVCMKFT